MEHCPLRSGNHGYTWTPTASQHHLDPYSISLPTSPFLQRARNIPTPGKNPSGYAPSSSPASHLLPRMQVVSTITSPDSNLTKQPLSQQEENEEDE